MAMAGAAAATRRWCASWVRRIPILLELGTGLESSFAREDQSPAFRRSTPDSGHFVETEVSRAVIGANHSVEKRARELT